MWSARVKAGGVSTFKLDRHTESGGGGHMSAGQVNGLKPKVSAYVRAAKVQNTTYTSIWFIPRSSDAWIIDGWSPVGCGLTLCFSSLQHEPDRMSQEMGWNSRQGAATSAWCRRNYTPHIFTGNSLVWVSDVIFHTTVTKRETRSDSPERHFFCRHIKWYEASQWIFPLFFYGMRNSLLGIDELYKTPSWISWELCYMLQISYDDHNMTHCCRWTIKSLRVQP